ncbi:hypothetical protein DOY81_000623 [Sarcophaga bullata]|nr:hypothetical protein DOY81_000623 [Sarcophaga bullata]
MIGTLSNNALKFKTCFRKYLLCKICKRKLNSPNALRRHIASKHSKIMGKEFDCSVCHKSFKTKWSLSTHNSRFHLCWKSTNFGPETFTASAQILRAASIYSTTTSISLSTNPRVVKAGVPKRIPEGFMADLSPGTVFLLQAILTSSKMYSAREPDKPTLRKSTNTKCTSVPPVAML